MPHELSGAAERLQEGQLRALPCPDGQRDQAANLTPRLGAGHSLALHSTARV